MSRKPKPPADDYDGWTDDPADLLDELARIRVASYGKPPARAPEPSPYDVPRITPAMTPDGRHRSAMQRYWMDVWAARQRAIIPRAPRKGPPRPS